MGELREDPRLQDRRHPFADRSEGGARIAALMGAVNPEDAILLAIPPNGIPTAEAIATERSLPWGLYFCQMIDAPEGGRQMGGVAWGGRTVWDRTVIGRSDITSRQLRSLRRQSLDAIRRRARRYGARPADVEGKKVILVDDGTTGWTALLASVRELRSSSAKVSLAMPMATRSDVLHLINDVDVLICPSVGREERLEGRGYWGSSLRDIEAMTVWLSRSNGLQNTRNLYQTVSTTSGISHDR